MMNRLFAWFRRRRAPKQLELSFYCGEGNCVYRNEKDQLHPSSGFYGVCWRCGVTYDPGCDR